MEELLKRYKEIIKQIKEHSPFDVKETNRMLEKFFGSIPTNVRILIRDYQFDKKKVLDIGCNYGETLLYWRNDSEGIEIQDNPVSFLSSLGRIVHKINVEDGFSSLKKENYDAIYSNNLIEHLLSPHLFLVRLHTLLKSNSLLAIGHPVLPSFPFNKLLKLIGYQGWLAVEHINFFTHKTSKLTFERAGFKVIRQYFFPKLYKVPILSKVGILISPSCLSICKKINTFKYNTKRITKFNPSWASDIKQFQ